MIPSPSEIDCGCPDSIIEVNSETSRLPDESESRIPKIASTIAFGATCPVTEVIAASNSNFERRPFPSESNLENSLAASYPLFLRIDWRFLIAIASIPAPPFDMAQPRG